MSDQQTWLTAADAAQVLRVSARQVHRYAEMGQLVTRRAGRRVLFSAASVAQLADDLAVDIRPATQSRDLIPPELVRHIGEQAEQMRRYGETSERIEQRLDRMEQKLGQPGQLELPGWVVGLLIAIVVLLLAVLILIIWRGV
jgi:hypothetical protein